MDHSNTFVKELTEANFEKYINSNSNVMIDFWASWCEPCKKMRPDYEAAAKHMEEKEKSTGLMFMSLDINAEEDITTRHNIKAMPTIVLYKNGVIVDRLEGRKTKDQILELIHKYF